MFPTTVNQIQALLEEALEPQELEVRDDSHHHVGHRGAQENPNKGHFYVKVIDSPKLNGLSRVEQHKLIYQTLDTVMDDIHALAITVRESA